MGTNQATDEPEIKVLVWYSKAAFKRKSIYTILLMAALNSYLIVSSFSGKTRYLDSKVRIAIPLLPAEPLQANKPVLPDGIRERIENFKSHIDSLGRTAEGKVQRDSILQKRRGLIDSITRIEQLYQQLNNQ